MLSSSITLYSVWRMPISPNLCNAHQNNQDGEITLQVRGKRVFICIFGCPPKFCSCSFIKWPIMRICISNPLTNHSVLFQRSNYVWKWTHITCVLLFSECCLASEICQITYKSACFDNFIFHTSLIICLESERLQLTAPMLTRFYKLLQVTWWTRC